MKLRVYNNTFVNRVENIFRPSEELARDASRKKKIDALLLATNL